jgi:adenylate cyclase
LNYSNLELTGSWFKNYTGLSFTKPENCGQASTAEGVFLKANSPGKKWGLQKRRCILQALTLFVISCFFTLIIALVQPFYTFNLWFADQFMETENPSKNIVIAGIDDASLKTYGKWSEWPRDLHARAVINLSSAGATAIGYDIVFADESPDDSSFAEALRDSGNVVLAVAGIDRITGKGGPVTLNEFLTPVSALDQSSHSIGHVNIVPDPDGKVRRIPLIVKGPDGETYPSLSLAVLYTLFHKPLPDIYEQTNHKINLLLRDVPVDDSFSMRLNFAVSDNSLTYISYADLISNSFDHSLVKNKIVLVGMTATGDLDSWSIPNSPVRIPGVMIHAAAMDTVLRTQFLTEAGMNITVLTMLLLGLICALVLPLFGTWRRIDIIKVVVFVLGLSIVYGVASSLVAERGYILNILYPTLTLGVIFIGNTVYMVLREQSDKKFVKDLFGRYVSPQISKEIISLASDGELKLGGEQREVTVLFADIRGFTALSERMSPGDVVKMLNKCLPIMIEAIVRNSGLVNKFAGDNLMGVWNAPQSQSGHPALAVKAAWEAQNEMEKAGDCEPLLKGVHFGVGINTGQAVAGNLGSTGRAEYTVIGDAVNLASRICGVAPGGDVLIGPETYHLVKETLDAEPQPPQMFKGKSQPLVVYKVTGMSGLIRKSGSS